MSLPSHRPRAVIAEGGNTECVIRGVKLLRSRTLSISAQSHIEHFHTSLTLPAQPKLPIVHSVCRVGRGESALKLLS